MRSSLKTVPELQQWFAGMEPNSSKTGRIHKGRIGQLDMIAVIEEGAVISDGARPGPFYTSTSE